MEVIIIPAYKPNQTFITFFKELRSEYSQEIIVVDDGSGKEYESAFDSVKHQCTLLRHPVNQGKGIALKTAYQYLMDKGYTGSIVTCDCDGQHAVKDILKILKESKNNSNALVLGCRKFDQDTPLRSQLGNRLTALAFGLITKIRLDDTQTGLRAFHSKYLDAMSKIQGNRYEYEMNVLLECSSFMEYKIIPIKTIYIDHNRASHYNALKDSIRILKEIITFSLSGLTSFVVDFIAFTILVSLFAGFQTSLRLMLANGLARMISATLNYQMNKRFVFGGSQKHSVLKYGGLALAILAFNTLLMNALYHLGLSQVVVLKVVVEMICFFINWTIQKKYVFTKGVQYEHSY